MIMDVSINPYVRIVVDLDSIRKVIEKLDFIVDLFVYGSVSKHCVSEDSDLDVIVIGTKEKTIDTMNELSKCFDEQCYSEIDVKYYNVEDFKHLVNTDPFLLSIEKDCKRLEEVQCELLRFCE